jgi:hypothetical protein
MRNKARLIFSAGGNFLQTMSEMLHPASIFLVYIFLWTRNLLTSETEEGQVMETGTQYSSIAHLLELWIVNVKDLFMYNTEHIFWRQCCNWSILLLFLFWDFVSKIDCSAVCFYWSDHQMVGLNWTELKGMGFWNKPAGALNNRVKFRSYPAYIERPLARPALCFNLGWLIALKLCLNAGPWGKPHLLLPNIL